MNNDKSGISTPSKTAKCASSSVDFAAQPDTRVDAPAVVQEPRKETWRDANMRLAAVGLPPDTDSDAGWEHKKLTDAEIESMAAKAGFSVCDHNIKVSAINGGCTGQVKRLVYLALEARASSAAPSKIQESAIKTMVDRFLGWKLPKDFYPDAGISFKPNKPYEGDEYGNSWWPIGTNLFTADQARAMFEYCLSSVGVDKDQNHSGHLAGGKPEEPPSATAWISVKDRLPEEHRQVLAYRNGRIGLGSWHGVEKGSPWTWTFNQAAGGDRMKFGYWMPLPAAPLQSADRGKP